MFATTTLTDYAVADSELKSLDIIARSPLFIKTMFIGLSLSLASLAVAQDPIRFLFAPATQTGLAPYNAALADLDGDGDLDAVTADYGDGETSTATVLINRGDGTFLAPVSYSVGDGAVDVKLGDFNGDGRPDMITANQMTGQNFGTRSYCTVLINNGNGTFGNRHDYDVGFNSYCGAVEIADFDKDGKLDWAAAAMWDGYIYVYRGLGNGTFALRNAIPASEPTGVVAADFNRDGRIDIAFHTVNDLYVMMNNGTSFGSPVYYDNWPANVADLAVADFNKDGAPDLVSVGFQTTVFVNDGFGAFSSKITFPVAETTTGVITGDFDGDTWIDFAGANYGENSASVYYNDGNLGFHDKRNWGVGFAPNGLAAGDLNADGKLDMLVVNSQMSQDTATVVLNEGDRNFLARREYAIRGYGYGIDIGDLNRDGYLDVATAVYVGNADRVTVFYGTADGSLSAPYDVEVFGNNIPTDVAIGDLNADGWPDLVASIFSPGNSIRVWLNRGDGTFNPSASYDAGGNPSGVGIGDLNGDGKADIVCSNGSSNDSSVSIFINKGNGTFKPQIRIGTLSRPSDVVFGDFDRDGDQDFVVTHVGSSSVLLFRNMGSVTFSLQSFNAGEVQSGGVVSDFNGDGWVDFVTGGGRLKFLPNIGGNFGPAVESPIVAAYVTAADLDRDGLLDGAGTNGVSSYVNFGPGAGNGTFGFEGTMAAGYNVGKIVAGDIDHDGFMELLTANGGRSISVFTNRTLGTPCKPDVMSLENGTAISGGLPEILLCDDRTFDVRPLAAAVAPSPPLRNGSRSEYPIAIIVEGTSPIDSPSSLAMVIESRSSVSGVGQVASLWDWSANMYRQIDSRLLKTVDDSLVLLATGDLRRFVQPGTNRIRAMLGYRPFASYVPPSWVVKVDQAGWRIMP
jgi:hypothetical protein